MVVMVVITGALIAATFLESIYDTPTAQYLVYKSWWFYLSLTLLGVTILCVALSRIPWKKSHGPFLMAHLGILLMLLGSWITYRAGIDGSIRLKEGSASGVVTLSDYQVTVEREVITVPWTPPRSKLVSGFKPIMRPDLGITIKDFMSHAEVSYGFDQGGIGDPPALEFELIGGLMKIRQAYWLWRGYPGVEDWAMVQAGPLTVRIAKEFEKGSNARGAEARVWFEGESVEVETRSTSAKNKKWKFKLSEAVGKDLDPGWKGGVIFKIKSLLPHGAPKATYFPSKIQYGPKAPPPAVLVSDGTTEVWLGMGDRTAFGDKVVRFDIKRIQLPFSILLERFEMDHYAGTRDPMSYRSKVHVVRDGEKSPEIEISMNEPLDERGFTFYQASFEEGDPRPTVSILSVNRDPGRWWKYVGSILIVFGATWLFARKYKRKA